MQTWGFCWELSLSVPMVQDDERKPEKWTLLMLSHFPSNAAEELLQNLQKKKESLFQLHQYCYQSTEICVWMLSGWDCPKAWMAKGTSASSWRKDVRSCWHKQVTNGETGCHQVMRIMQTLFFWCKDSLNTSMTVPPMLTGQPQDAADRHLSDMIWKSPQSCADHD